MVACPKCGEFILMGTENQLEGVRDAAPASEGSAASPTLEFTFDSPVVQEVMQPAESLALEEPQGPQEPLLTTVLDVNFTQINKTEVIPSTETGRPAVTSPEALAPTPMAAPSQFADVIEFANQEQETTGTGGLVYDVTISGIDTVETRQEVSACLSDKRLKLNPEKLMKSVKDGELTLNELNPVAASVLVGVIKHLTLAVSWKSRQLFKGMFIFLTLGCIGFGGLWESSARASDWARHEVNLKGYATKIENMQEDIRDLIAKKNQNKDPAARDEILKDIIKKNAELTGLYSDFKKEKEHIRFEHPEQGDPTERKYRHVKLKSLDELEDEVGLQGQLSRIKKKVETTYPKDSTPASSSPQTDQD